MGNAKDHLAGKALGEETGLHLLLPADTRAVRGALKQAMSYLRGLNISDDQAGSAELVLAEVINNVIEHAYAGHPVGIIELWISDESGRIDVTVLDEGVAMPGNQIPLGRPHDLDCEADALPEGGFGWFLIREITSNLSYSRDGVRNRLKFSLNFSDPENLN